MKKIIIFIFFLSSDLQAGSLFDSFNSKILGNPSVDDIEFVSYYLREPRASYEMGVVIVAKFKNNSQFYLKNIALNCTFYDNNNNRVGEKNQEVRFGTGSSSIAPGNTSTLSTATRVYRFSRIDCTKFFVDGEK